MFKGLKIALLAGLVGMAALASTSADAAAMTKGCTPEQALEKARKIGIVSARIEYVRFSRVGIVGRTNGHEIHLTISRTANCPIARIS